MRTFLLILSMYFWLANLLFSQELNLTPLLSNVVDIGNGNFGTIIGRMNEKSLLFVTVSDQSEPYFDGISVKYHGLSFEGVGTLLRSFAFGKYSLALYQCDSPSVSFWNQVRYDFFLSDKFSYWTFLDNGKSDNQWSIYRKPILLIQTYEGIATIRMGNNGLFSRGMPVFDNNGSIVGIIADKQDNDGHLIFNAIDFSVIEFYVLSNKIFQIAYNKNDID